MDQKPSIGKKAWINALHALVFEIIAIAVISIAWTLIRHWFK
jgi:hypothetical protein